MTLRGDLFASEVAELINAGSPVKKAIQRVVDKYGISFYAARNRYRRANMPKPRSARNQLLTDEDNEILITLARAFSIASIPFDRCLLRKAVHAVAGVTPSKNWISRWMKADRERVRLRKSKQLASKRAAAANAQDIEEFIDAVEAKQLSYPMKDRHVVNCDETRVCVGMGGQIVLEAAEKERSSVLTPKANTLASCLCLGRRRRRCSFWVVRHEETDLLNLRDYMQSQDQAT